MSAFPLPTGPGTLVAPAPALGPQNWAGAPSAAYDEDGSIVLAYRLRWADGPTDANVIARAADGERFETIVALDKGRWGAAMVERPALIRLDDGWRLYVCCATPNSKHWWIGLVEAPTLEGLADAGHAAFGADEVVLAAGVDGATVLRWELTEWSVDDAKLSAHIELDPWADYAMRCERDGGAAAGQGIGCVLRGELMVDGEPVQPFGAFVEPAEIAGRGSFVRVVLVRAEDSNGAEALAQGAVHL